MLTIFRLFFFLTALKNTQGSFKVSSKQLEYPWVIGATRCSIKDYSFVVSIRRYTSLDHICGGTLILPSWVLTSTTCLTGYTKGNIRVTAGSECLTTTLTKIDLKNSAGAAKIILHPNSDIHNIALIKLKKRLKQSLTVSYVKLANYFTSLDDAFFKNCLNSTILGWGYGLNSTKEVGGSRYINEPQCLHCINFSFATRCSERALDPKTKTEICSDPNQKEYCQGDSGGPLMCKNVQIGIVKVGCLHAGSSSFYTRVDNHDAFIYNAINAGSHFYFRFLYFVIISFLIQ